MTFLKRLPAALLVTMAAMQMLTTCKQSPPAKKTAAAKNSQSPSKISFKKVEGIAFTEVRREYANRLGFNDEGYHLEPEWRVTFLSDDTVRIFSLVLQKFIKQEVVLDHDSVVNVAHSWLRVKHVSKDSMLFQVLYVRNMHIDEDNSNIYMKLYSNDYIKNVLHTTPEHLQIPPRRDSLFIQKKVKESLADINKAFAATEPAILESINKNVVITKKEITRPNLLKEEFVSDNYLSPEFTITIHKAYDDFGKKMQVIVDQNGQLHFARSLVNAYENAEHQAEVMKGIVDGYLRAYIKTYPGRTLGIPHPSRIVVNVIGKKN